MHEERGRMTDREYKERGRTPTAELTLYLPPTHSQNPKTFSSEMPNYFVASRFVETAHKC